MKKVLVIGSPGAGKSTLARRLGVITGLPVIHLDRLYFKPGWIETPLSEWIRIQEDLVKQAEWIIDGTYGKTLDIRLRQADTVIFLDVSRYICLWRAMKRIQQHYGDTRGDMAEGCEERLDGEFLRYIWRFPRDQRPRILSQLQQAHLRGSKIIHLRHSSEISHFLESLMTAIEKE
ncbi:DNA topology modulation protein [Sulfobacillus thermosulfidooxidans]|uniref:DNA topology modulation protein n=1 Tax=Sulfobacillus thermosulfidooxidans TaxID=28034 RepID=UPI0006B58856|nr:DNA topology modulation protein [Sulfobacillus thermosulfidooxidans]